jgi:hypothetical protein
MGNEKLGFWLPQRFYLQNIEQLIARGIKSAVEHNCKAEGCILPNSGLAIKSTMLN